MVNENKWIDAKKRLPKTDRPVLVWYTFQLGYVEKRQRANMSLEVYENGSWSLDMDDRHNAEVTHWMPLPNPPHIKKIESIKGDLSMDDETPEEFGERLGREIVMKLWPELEKALNKLFDK